MRTNVPGKVLFALVDTVVLFDLDRRPSLRAVAGFDALALVLSAFWHTRFWDTPTAVEAFLAESREHYLTRTPFKPAGILVLVAGLYAAFVSLFAWQLALVDDPPRGYAREYCVAGIVWHAWCAAPLLLAAAIRRFYEEDLVMDKTGARGNAPGVIVSARADFAPQRPLWMPVAANEAFTVSLVPARSVGR